MNIHDGRTFFASRAEMLRTVRMSFKNLYAADGLQCICGEDDHLAHLTSCSSYSHLKTGLSVEDNDLHLVRFYQRVIRERELEEDKRRGV